MYADTGHAPATGVGNGVIDTWLISPVAVVIIRRSDNVAASAEGACMAGPLSGYRIMDITFMVIGPWAISDVFVHNVRPGVVERLGIGEAVITTGGQLRLVPTPACLNKHRGKAAGLLQRR
jgi:hypothetical protein